MEIIREEQNDRVKATMFDCGDAIHVSYWDKVCGRLIAAKEYVYSDDPGHRKCLIVASQYMEADLQVPYQYI